LGLDQVGRATHVFDLLAKWYRHTAPPGERANFQVAEKPVCREVFLLAYPVGGSTLDRLIHRVSQNEASAYDAQTMGGRAPSLASATIQAATWLLLWAQTHGERIPGVEYDGKLYAPVQSMTELWKQMNIQRATDGLRGISLSTVRSVWNSHPLLSHIRMRRKKLAFHDCEICTTLRTNVKRAASLGSKKLLAEARECLHEHFMCQRREREVYYLRRWESRQPESESLCLIFDKWSCWTTICPYFARSPGNSWQAIKERVLKNHVLLVQACLRHLCLHTPCLHTPASTPCLHTPAFTHLPSHSVFTPLPSHPCLHTLTAHTLTAHTPAASPLTIGV
jgi:hypothetical protein